LRKCREAGIDVVVRPSGGRAVLHGDDVTYAAAFPAGGLFDAGGIHGTYRRIAEMLRAALEEIGVRVEVADAREAGGPGRAVPCFTSAARHEILVGGRKVVGSAQRRTREAVLQHGAILVRGNQAKLAEFVADAEAQAALKRSLEGRTVTLEEILERPVSFEEVSLALRRAAMRVLGLDVQEGELTQEERRMVDKYMESGVLEQRRAAGA